MFCFLSSTTQIQFVCNSDIIVLELKKPCNRSEIGSSWVMCLDRNSDHEIKLASLWLAVNKDLWKFDLSSIDGDKLGTICDSSERIIWLSIYCEYRTNGKLQYTENHEVMSCSIYCYWVTVSIEMSWWINNWQAKSCELGHEVGHFKNVYIVDSIRSDGLAWKVNLLIPPRLTRTMQAAKRGTAKGERRANGQTWV